MWPFAVIQHQIFSHSLIKQIQVVKKQQFIEFNKLFSKCPVKSLTGRIHFRCVRIGPDVFNRGFLQRFIKVSKEFLTVVSNNLFDSNRKELCGLAEEMAGDIAVE
ncbi:hypothetical protein SB6095_05282 [Klebsiella quasivariicola]|uniref:Uncharacterized protein n=1 Tax=Klebsiella variicola TaxID=244366 RepID=A0ABD7PES8_KLEVA|nr:Uncharacterised protein [Klebsiella pneumoniae]SXE36712.1 Uncharacterised protein [Klebsiella variicola]VGQ15284.1 hypothetical protein SB6095_05282 [Klebsiella quasivariicola]SVX95732.1 Uncharacterised protein [Klebsiella pneumoniae]SWN91467.1 Uncharacterised protein [Klebsiella pneumoniae]